MLSYQHAYHAGGRADVLKHAVLHAILRDIHSSRKPLQSIIYVETHAGRGVYDLTKDTYAKTGEAAEGILSLIKDDKAPESLAPWLADYGEPSAYLGSPGLARKFLANSMDRFVFIDKHPTEFSVLKDNLSQKNTRLIKGDGYKEALRLTPRRSEQLVLFLDPSYETIRDLEEMAAWVPRALEKWPEAIVIVWLPRFLDEREVEFGQWLAGLDNGVIVGAEWGNPPEGKDTALVGSAMVGYRVSKKVGKIITQIGDDLNAYWKV